jgi:hypothetical protein
MSSMSYIGTSLFSGIITMKVYEAVVTVLLVYEFV